MAHSTKLVGPSPRVETPEPMPLLPDSIGEVEREIRELTIELGREVNVEKAELLIQRLDILQRKRQAHLLTEENLARERSVEEAAAAARADREAKRAAKGLTLAQVQERVRQLEHEQQGLLAELDIIQRDAEHLLTQAHRECPTVPPSLVWETAHGTILRASRDIVDQKRYSVHCELTALRPLLEPDEVPQR